MDEDVLKTAVQGEWNHPLRSEKLFWSVPRLVLVGVPWICGVAEAKDRFFLTAYYMLSDLWSGHSGEWPSRTFIHFKQMEYKYPEGKVLTDDEAKQLFRKEMDEQIDALKRKHGMAT